MSWAAFGTVMGALSLSAPFLWRALFPPDKDAKASRSDSKLDSKIEAMLRKLDANHDWNIKVEGMLDELLRYIRELHTWHDSHDPETGILRWWNTAEQTKVQQKMASVLEMVYEHQKDSTHLIKDISNAMRQTAETQKEILVIVREMKQG
jgi:hypothetical protein